jgi:3'(2'), 5'-bisphosphate nucleotidase
MHVPTASLCTEVRRIARQAGARIMGIYGGDIAVTYKGDDSPLTAADAAAHEEILAGLTQLTPDIPVWSEESATVPFAERGRWPRFWLVDPLDGTKEFIKRNGEFTVNIALVEGHTPVLGVVLAPALDREYFGHGGKAFRVDSGGAPRAIHVRQATSSPVRVAGSRSHRGDSLDGFLGAIGPHEFISMGSSLKFCLVAEGLADVYPRLGPTSEWDTAAAQAVLTAAGGEVTTLQGEALPYNKGPEVLNPHFVAFGARDVDWVHRLVGS